MGSPAPIRRLLDSLYRGTFATISVGAAEPEIVRMRSGICHGCAASGSVFALPIGALLRGLMVASPDGCNGKDASERWAFRRGRSRPVWKARCAIR